MKSLDNFDNVYTAGKLIVSLLLVCNQVCDRSRNKKVAGVSVDQTKKCHFLNDFEWKLKNPGRFCYLQILGSIKQRKPAMWGGCYR